MDRKKLIKLGISVLAVNALGAVAVYKYPELTHVPTVYAEEQPGEDEEIPDAAEAQAATNFKNQMDEFEKAINEFNPDDSDTKESLQYALEDAEGYHTTAVNAIKSEEGKKGFAKYEARYQALKAKAQALLMVNHQNLNQIHNRNLNQIRNHSQRLQHRTLQSKNQSFTDLQLSKIQLYQKAQEKQKFKVSMVKRKLSTQSLIQTARKQAV